MRHLRAWPAWFAGTWMFLCCPGSGAIVSAASFRFVKSQSGPSGKTIDNRFQFDEIRNRFVYPQDKFLTVYFEWEGPPGDHVLTAYWKDPQGAVASISPDVKVETKTPELHAYWIFEIAPAFRSGIWTAEIRIDGEPSGAHNFEIVLPAVSPSPEAAPPQERKLPTLDEIYASADRSLVWIHKLDQAGRHIDTALGFVIGADRVATAFQAIDAATRVEVVFGDGRKVASDQVWAYDRLQDWAILKAETASIPALSRAQGATVPVGERYIVFNVENETTRVIGGVDITGKRTAGDFGDRIQLMPSPSREAIGGPLLNPMGEVVGIVGGSVAPGSRFGAYAISVSPSLWSRLNMDVAATPIAALPSPDQATAVTLGDLLAQGVLTPPLTPTPSVVYGGSARSVSKAANDTSTNDTSEFSRRDRVAWIYTLWQKKDKNGKGVTSAKVYDYRNRLLVEIAPKKISLPDGAPTRVAFDFSIETFPAGLYRVDVYWNDQPAWRTFFRVTD
jgi:S1-C subfamily serine protease